MKQETDFKEFWFDGNMYYGFIKNEEKVKELLKAYTLEELYKAKSHKNFNPDEPEFGFYSEFTGSLKLGEWLETTSMIKYFKTDK